jgi:hypothetical protein
MRNCIKLLKIIGVLTPLILLVNVSNAQSNSFQQTTKTTTRYGLYSIKDDLNSRLVAANNIGVDYVRYSVLLSTWNNVSSFGIDYWLSRKKKIVLNINNDDTPSYFPANLAAYKKKLQSFLNVYGDSIKLAVIENEELNDTQALAHYGSLQSYINELTVAVALCNNKKIPVTNGGITTQIVASLKHYYDINGKTDSSQWLVTQMGSIPADSMVWKRCDSLLAAYKNLALNYVNLHWYEPKSGMNRITGVLQTVCNYITTQTGKKVITNETGTKSDSSFVTQLLQQWALIKPYYCILFDGIGINGALPLTSSTGVLLPNGIACRNYIGGGKACTKSITISPSGFVNSCADSTVKLTASSGFGNYFWNTGQTTQSITVKATGNYSVKSNHQTCMAYSKSAAAIMMYAPPQTPGIATTPSPSLNICEGKSVNLSSTVANSYIWNTGETTKNIKVINPGNYTVTISDINGCRSISNVTVVTYNACNPPGNLSVNGISINKATLSWTVPSCAAGYQVQYRIKGLTSWTSQQLLNGATSSKIIYGLTAAIYQWRMLTYCSYLPDTVQSAYVYGPEFTIAALKNTSNAIAANVNGFDVKVYPVPATNVAYVSVNPVSDDLKIMLTDVYGKLLWQSEKINSSVTKLPVANLASGTYMVIVKDKQHYKTLWLIK